MTPEDLAALHARCFTMPRPWGADEFAGLLDSPDCFVCAQPGGFSMGRVTVDEAELLTIAVAPDARRRGLGRALVQAFEQTAVSRGASQAFLEVAATNAAAIALYRAAGFEQVGLRPGYYRDADGNRIDALVLQKKFAP